MALACRRRLEPEGPPRPRAAADACRAWTGSPWAYHGTAWTLGREAALLPIDALADQSLRAPWSWQAVTVGRSLAAVEPSMARDGRVVQLVDGGAEALAAVAIVGSVGRLPGRSPASPIPTTRRRVIELIPPGAAMPGPRTRANVTLQYTPGGPGDPDLVPGKGLFAPPERFDQRPFGAFEPRRSSRRPPSRRSALAASPPAWSDCSARSSSASTDPGSCDGCRPERDRATDRAGTPTRRLPHRRPARACRPSNSPRASRGRRWRPVAPAGGRRGRPDPVERLLGLIRDELAPRSAAPDRDRTGRAGGDGQPTRRRPRRRWPTGSSGPSSACCPPPGRSEAAFYDRIATLFTGHDLPDETLVRACLDSYRSLASTPDHLVTSDDLLRRSQEHTDLWQHRRCGPPARAARLDRRAGAGPATRPRPPWRRPRRAREGRLPGHDRPSCGCPVEGRRDLVHPRQARASCSRSSGPPCSASRCSGVTPVSATTSDSSGPVVAPERTDLIRHKLDRSPLLRAAIEDDGWNLIKWDHLADLPRRGAPRLRRSRATHRSRPGRGTRRRAEPLGG